MSRRLALAAGLQAIKSLRPLLARSPSLTLIAAILHTPRPAMAVKLGPSILVVVLHYRCPSQTTLSVVTRLSRVHQESHSLVARSAQMARARQPQVPLSPTVLSRRMVHSLAQPIHHRDHGVGRRRTAPIVGLALVQGHQTHHRHGSIGTIRHPSRPAVEARGLP